MKRNNGNRPSALSGRRIFLRPAGPLRMSDLAQRIACRTGLFKEEVEEVFLALEQEVAWAYQAHRPLRTGRIALGWKPGAACLRRSRSPRWDACRWMEVEGLEKNNKTEDRSKYNEKRR